MAAVLSVTDAITAGSTLLAVVAVAYGGRFVFTATNGGFPANDLQQRFFRAGHAHAGVLIILGLVVKLYVALVGVTGLLNVLSSGVLYAAILMPAGFFLSAIGRNPTHPNRWIVLLWIGAGVLVVGLIAAGVGLILSATR